MLGALPHVSSKFNYVSRRERKKIKIRERLKRELMRGCRQMSPKDISYLENMEPQELTVFLLEIFPHLNEGARSSLKEVLQKGGITGSFLGLLISREPLVRAQAAEVLGLLGTGGVVEPLLKALADREEIVSLAAAKSLARLKKKHILPFLIGMLAKPGCWPPARVGEVLAAYGEKAVPYLVSALDQEKESVKERAIEILGEIGSPEAASALVGALKDTSSCVRAKAAEALGKVGGFHAEEALQASLKDASWQVRCRSAKALGQVGTHKSIETLKKAQKDPEWCVRVNAQEALEKIIREEKPLEET